MKGRNMDKIRIITLGLLLLTTTANAQVLEKVGNFYRFVWKDSIDVNPGETVYLNTINTSNFDLMTIQFIESVDQHFNIETRLETRLYNTEPFKHTRTATIDTPAGIEIIDSLVDVDHQPNLSFGIYGVESRLYIKNIGSTLINLRVTGAMRKCDCCSKVRLAP